MTSNYHCAILAAIGLCIAAPAVGQPADTSRAEAPIVVIGKLRPSSDLIVRTVSIRDLDLKAAAGRQEMEKRVGQAVDSMCAIPVPIPTYGAKMEKPCRDEAWASARPQMDDAVRLAGGS